MDYHRKILAVTRVVDGDTLDVVLDQGFYSTIKVRVRVADVDTWEVFGVNRDPVRGPAASRATAGWLAERAGHVGVQTFRAHWSVPVPRGGFGRWLGIVYDLRTGDVLADWLIANGHDKRYPTGA